MGNNSRLIFLVDFIRCRICNALTEQRLHINLCLGGYPDIFLSVERNQYVKYLLGYLILHHPCNLFRILAGKVAFLLGSVNLLSSTVKNHYLLCFQSGNSGCHQPLNSLSLLNAWRAIILHGQHCMCRSLLHRILCQNILAFLPRSNGYGSVLYSVNEPDGCCNPVLQIIQCITILVGIRSHKTSIFCKHLIAKTTLWISLKSQACSSLIQNILRYKDLSVACILIINF